MSTSTSTSTSSTTVTRLAAWTGWCSPCQSEDRPLVLTRTGPAGLRAWLSGHGDDDRLLLLTCNVCGQWQVVPPREEDDPEVVVPPAPAVVLPRPRAEAPAVLDLTDAPAAPAADVAAAAAALSALAAYPADPAEPAAALRTA